MSILISFKNLYPGAPVVVSSAHFLYGDGFYINMVEGVSPPIKEEHEAALVFEPVSIFKLYRTSNFAHFTLCSDKVLLVL